MRQPTSQTSFVIFAPPGVPFIPTMVPSGVLVPSRVLSSSIPRTSYNIPQNLNTLRIAPANETAVRPEAGSEPAAVYEAAIEPERRAEEIVRFEPNRPALVPPTGNANNFSRFHLRFNGVGDIRPFIRAVLDFKEWTQMSDETALRGFPLLLTDLAAIWWQTNKHTLTTWTKAIEDLRSTYRARPQPYKVYRHLFTTLQKSEPTAVFVKKARAILNQLPAHTLTEDTQLDVVYGLLHRRIREKVNRDDCHSFADLLNFARHVEVTLDKTSDSDLSETPNSPATRRRPIKIQPGPRQLAAPIQVSQRKPSSNVAKNYRNASRVWKK